MSEKREEKGKGKSREADGLSSINSGHRQCLQVFSFGLINIQHKGSSDLEKNGKVVQDSRSQTGWLP